nr:MAG TPA: Ectropic viral integration site 2A protein (EVI2A) [Caudoviricetes sp.]
MLQGLICMLDFVAIDTCFLVCTLLFAFPLSVNAWGS